jgi:hypothetical protein
LGGELENALERGRRDEKRRIFCILEGESQEAIDREGC